MLKGLAPGVWAHVVDVEGFPTASVVVLTSRLALVVDTLSGPAEAAPVADFAASEASDGRVVVNTHHHWDHVFGNSAFAGADIVPQRACPGLIEAQLRDGDESSRRPPPGGVALPNVVFGDRLTYEDACGDVHLLHAPGHSEDSLVVFLPESRLLLGGDAVEWPLPDFCRRGGAGEWIRTLRRLRRFAADRIVPAYGPVMDSGVVDADERSIAGVYRAVAAAKSSGVSRDALDLPVERFLAEGVVVDDVYAAVHRENLLWAWDEV